MAAAARTNSDRLEVIESDRAEIMGRLAAIETEQAHGREQHREIRESLARIFDKLEELAEAFNRQPLACAKEFYAAIAEERKTTDQKLRDMSSKIWKVVGALVGIPGVVASLLWCVQLLRDLF